MGHFYNALLFEGLCTLVKLGQNGRNNGQTLQDVLRSESYNQRPYVRLGYLYPHWKPSPAQTFYRIGTPLADEMAFEYVPDEDHVSPMYALGVVVISPDRLKKMQKTDPEALAADIQNQGVYRIRGYLLPYSTTDGDPLILPIDWAEKVPLTSAQEILQKLCFPY